MPSTYDPTPEALRAVSWARQWVGRQAFQDKCLALARSAWGASGMGGTAAQAWGRIAGTQYAHSDGSAPPVGAAVYFTGGGTGAGHVAIVSKYVNGQAYIITNDYPHRGVVGEVPLSDLMRSWKNLHYQGWGSSINGTVMNLGAPPKGRVTVADVANTSSAGTGGSVATKPASAQDVADFVQKNFGLTDALIKLDKSKGKNLQWAFNQIRTQGITDPMRAANILAQTEWFKTHGADVTQRLGDEKAGSGAFKEQVAAQYATLKDQMAAKGIHLSDADLKSLARDAYVYGLNASQVLDEATSKKSATYGGGEIGQDLTGLDALAQANGVTLPANQRNAWSRDILAGNKTVQDYEQMVRDNAAQTYQVFGDKIKAGQNLSDLVQPYTQMASQLLETGNQSLDMADPLFKDGKAFQTVGADGKPAIKPLWEFRKDVMSDPRWQYTQNARQTYTDFGKSVLQRFGMVS